MKMRKLFFAAASFAAAWAAGASAALRVPHGMPEGGRDTVVIMSPDSVVMEARAGGEFRVTVHGQAGNPQFRYSRQVCVDTDEPVVERERRRDWDFNVPFSSRSSKASRKCSHSFCMSGLTLGFVRPLDAPAGMHTDWGASLEIAMPMLLGYGYHTASGRFDFSVGLGLGWRNLRMTGRTRFVKDGDRLVMGSYPEGADIKFSRLKFFSLMVPLMATCHLGRGFELKLGPVLNFNTFANVKTRYCIDGHKVKEKFGNIHQRPVTADVMAVLEYRGVGFYTHYSPCNLLNADFGPDFQTLSMGVALFY